jgi:hypothetical protein
LVLSLTNVSARTLSEPSRAGPQFPDVFVQKEPGIPLKLTAEGIKNYVRSKYAAGSAWEDTIPPGWSGGRVLPLNDFYDLSKPDRYAVMAGYFYGKPIRPSDKPLDVVSNIVVFDNRPAGSAGGAVAPKSGAKLHAASEPQDKEWNEFAKLAGKSMERCALSALMSPTEPEGSALIVSLRRVEIGDDPWSFRFDCGYDMTDYKLVVRGPDGRAIPFTPDDRYRNSLKKRPSTSLEACAPGGGVGTRFPLSKWFNMKEPGEYSVLAILPRKGDPTRAWVAEPIKVRVGRMLPPGKK